MNASGVYVEFRLALCLRFNECCPMSFAKACKIFNKYFVFKEFIKEINS